MTDIAIKKPVKIGRPTKYTKVLSEQVCAMLAQGQSMRTVCKNSKMPSMQTIFTWLRKYPDFLEQYERAKLESADALTDEMIDIADEEAMSDLVIDGVPVLDPNTGNPYKILTSAGVQHARLRVDTRKWIASKLKPKKYGDKVTNEHQALNAKGDKQNWEVTFINSETNNEVKDK